MGQGQGAVKPTSETIEAIVLAAGAGARFGGGKLTAPWRDGVLLDGALAAAFAAPCRTVAVTFGADPAVAEAARGFAERAGTADRLRLIHAPDHAEGLAASLRAGLAGLPADAAAAMIFLGDMPNLPLRIGEALADTLRPGIEAAAPARRGRRGHPVLIRRSLFAQIAALRGDRGAGALLEGLGPRLALVPAPSDGVLFDVDRREDLAARP